MFPDPNRPHPPLHQDYIDTEVWSRLEALLRNPKEQLETLRAAQVKQLEEHAEAIDHLAAAEQAKAEYDHKLRQYYQDYEDGLLPRDLFIEKKADLDQRLNAVQVVAAEYRAVLDTILTDDDITTITQDLTALRDELENLDDLPNEKRREVIEMMHVTGKLLNESDTIVMWVYVYSIPIGSLSVEANSETSRSSVYTTEQSHNLNQFIDPDSRSIAHIIGSSSLSVVLIFAQRTDAARANRQIRFSASITESDIGGESRGGALRLQLDIVWRMRIVVFWPSVRQQARIRCASRS